MKRKVTMYKYEINNGIYVLTAKTTDINPYNIERILGKVQVKGRKTDFELIEIKSRHFDYDGKYLIKRSDLTYEIIGHFIESCDGCVRSKQNHPYERDLLDKDLLNDLGIQVLTYKYFYIGDNKIRDLYYPFIFSDDDYTLDEDDLQAIHRELDSRTNEAIEAYKEYNNDKSKKETATWTKI